MAIQALESQVCSCCWEGRVGVRWSAVATTMKGWQNEWLGARRLVASFPGRIGHWPNQALGQPTLFNTPCIKKKGVRLLQSSPLACCLYMEELSKFECSQGTQLRFFYIVEELWAICDRGLHRNGLFNLLFGLPQSETTLGLTRLE